MHFTHRLVLHAGRNKINVIFTYQKQQLAGTLIHTFTSLDLFFVFTLTQSSTATMSTARSMLGNIRPSNALTLIVNKRTDLYFLTAFIKKFIVLFLYFPYEKGETMDKFSALLLAKSAHKQACDVPTNFLSIL